MSHILGILRRSSLNREIRVNFCDGVPHRSQGSMGLKYTEQLLHTTPYSVSLPIGLFVLITSNTGLFLNTFITDSLFIISRESGKFTTTWA
ncbi:hypothetical protein ABVN80_02550 [Acinetobacter baumannii]